MKKSAMALFITLCLSALCCGCGSGKNPPVRASTPEELFSAVCSAEDGLMLAREVGAVAVEGYGQITGAEVWDAFLEKTEAGEPAGVLIAQYYTLDPERVSPELYREEKDEYPKLFFTYLAFDGREYSVSVRQSTAPEPETRDEKYPFLLSLRAEAKPTAAVGKPCMHYVLADEKDLSWERIERAMVSSVWEEAFGFRRHIVFSRFLDE